MMSVANYHISYLQISESERRLKVSNILKLFSSQTVLCTSSLQEFIQSFSSKESADYSNEVDLDPFLTAILDLSGIECDSQSLQSLAFIASYSVHQFLKKCDRLCRICDDALTVEKRLVADDLSESQFKLLLLSDRGSLKYPSEIVQESIVDVWKIVIKFENSNDLMAMLVEGPVTKYSIRVEFGPAGQNISDIFGPVGPFLYPTKYSGIIF